jgi:hypothetical protein
LSSARIFPGPALDTCVEHFSTRPRETSGHGARRERRGAPRSRGPTRPSRLRP